MRRLHPLAAALLAGALCSCAGVAAARTHGHGLRITVFAAASLANAFEAGEPAFAASAHSAVRFVFAGSQQLVQNVLDGAPADVVATADTETMQRLVDAHLVDTPVTFARNRLEIAVAPGNPKHITGLTALARADVTLVLAAPSVPAGRYAMQILRNAAVSAHPVSLELEVTSALEKVEAGDADAAIVYVTDVESAGGRVDGVPIPDPGNVVATYPIAVVRGTHDEVAAQAFLHSAVSGVVQMHLRRDGFLTP